MKEKRTITIRDVAAEAGVSPYTVSSVLNNKGDISEVTSKRVLAAARKLKYNILGNVIAAQKVTTRSVGIVLPEPACLHSSFYNRSIFTFRDFASQRDFDCKLFVENDIIRRFDPNNNANLHSLGCKGVVVFCPNGDYQSYIPRLLRQGVAVALVRREMKGRPGLFQAINDEFASVWELINYAYETKGCRRLALISNHVPSSGGTDNRTRVFQEFIAKHLLKESLLLDAANERENWIHLEAFIQRGQAEGEKPIVFCWNDDCALDTMFAMHQQRLEAPRDYYVTGINDDRQAARNIPSLATIRIPVEEMMVASSRYIIEYNSEAGLPPAQTIDFPPTLQIRDSLGGK